MQSVLGQEYKNIDYILVDGGSSEESLALGSQLKRDGLVRAFVRESDRGPYDAMAKGAAIATGDYICFLNSGDTFASSGTLAQVASSLQQQNPDCLIGWGRLGDQIWSTWLSDRSAVRMASLGFCHQAEFIRLEVFRAVPFRNTSQTDNDTFQLAEIIDRGFRVEILSKVLAIRDPSPGLSAWGELSTLSVLSTLRESYGFSESDAQNILAFRRRAEAQQSIRQMLNWKSLSTS